MRHLRELFAVPLLLIGTCGALALKLGFLLQGTKVWVGYSTRAESSDDFTRIC